MVLHAKVVVVAECAAMSKSARECFSFMSPVSIERRFLWALSGSMFLHGLVLLIGLFLHGWLRTLPAAEEKAPPAAMRLDATLLSSPEPVPPDEPLLKNTLAEARSEKVEPAPTREETPPPPIAPRDALPHPKIARDAPKVVREAQLKLAAHMFYPPEAIAQGLEGEARILLELAADGTILEASLAASSGHVLLDQAALNAALAMRRVPASGTTELILPVVFKLQ